MFETQEIEHFYKIIFQYLWYIITKLHFMKTITFLIVFTILFFNSCIPFQTLTSTTNIKPKESFLLGNNIHGKFSAKVTNTSVAPITIRKCPIKGGKHSPLTLNQSSTIKVKVEKNTALRIENDSEEQISIQLKVSGDIGLSMGYQK